MGIGGRMTHIEIPRPSEGDVVDLIVADHKVFEELLRELRDATADREGARNDLANLLIAHGEAEESEVYPKLVRKDAIEGEDVEHAEHEHAEGNEKLLALLECKATDTAKFDTAVEELQKALTHHLGEEEQTILNPARTDVDDATRGRLGATFARVRADRLDAGVGDIDYVRTLVKQARREGKLDTTADA